MGYSGDRLVKEVRMGADSGRVLSQDNMGRGADGRKCLGD